MTTSSSDSFRRAHNAIYGAFDLPCSARTAARVGDHEAQIIVTMHANDGGIAENFYDAADQLAILIRR